MRRCIGTCGIVLSLIGSAFAFPFDSIFVMDGEVLAVEAEECYAGDYWVFDQTEGGYTGSGYMRYAGPEAICLDPGETDATSPFDEDGRCQTDPRSRLRIPVRITERASYNINARCFAYTSGVGPNSHASGKDHTAWIMVEELLDETTAGSGHTEDGATRRWTWFSYGPGSNQHPDVQVAYNLEPGDYVFYLGGRHVNFRADRIHIYGKTGRTSYPLMDTVAALTATQKTLYEPLSDVRAPVGTKVAPRQLSGGARWFSLSGRAMDAAAVGKASRPASVYLVRTQDGKVLKTVRD